jgi:hypothetical protein
MTTYKYDFPISYKYTIPIAEESLIGLPDWVKYEKVDESPESTVYKIKRDDIGDLVEMKVFMTGEASSRVILRPLPYPFSNDMSVSKEQKQDKKEYQKYLIGTIINRILRDVFSVLKSTGQIGQHVTQASLRYNLTRLERGIIDVHGELLKRGTIITDEMIATQLIIKKGITNPRTGEQYSREWINKRRNILISYGFKLKI